MRTFYERGAQLTPPAGATRWAVRATSALCGACLHRGCHHAHAILFSRPQPPKLSRFPDRHFRGFPRVCALSTRTSTAVRKPGYGGCGRVRSVDWACVVQLSLPIVAPMAVNIDFDFCEAFLIKNAYPGLEYFTDTARCTAGLAFFRSRAGPKQKAIRSPALWFRSASFFFLPVPSCG